MQIAKEPMGTKGARLTSFDLAAGTPSGVHADQQPHRSFAANRERGGTRAAARGGRANCGREQGGFIVRTACEGVSKREIQRDVAFLTKLWASIVKQERDQRRRPRCSTAISTLRCASVRDLFSSEIDRLWCDDPETYERIVAIRAELHAAAASAHRAVRGRRADLRSFQDRAADRARARPQGLAQVGRLPGLRSGRSAHRDRRQHRPLRRQAQPGRDRSQDQSRSGRRSGQATAPAQYRRHHHRRLHRHDARGRSQASQRRAVAGVAARQGARPRCSRFPSSGWSR